MSHESVTITNAETALRIAVEYLLYGQARSAYPTTAGGEAANSLQYSAIVARYVTGEFPYDKVLATAYAYSRQALMHRYSGKPDITFKLDRHPGESFLVALMSHRIPNAQWIGNDLQLLRALVYRFERLLTAKLKASPLAFAPELV